MGAIWLACCESADYPQVLGEIEKRGGDRVLRFGSADACRDLAAAFPDGGINAVFCADASAIDLLERSICSLVATGRAQNVLVLCKSDDPGDMARLFYAGATEVIAVGGAAAPTECAARTDGRLGSDRTVAPPARDDEPNKGDPDRTGELADMRPPSVPAQAVATGRRAEGAAAPCMGGAPMGEASMELDEPEQEPRGAGCVNPAWGRLGQTGALAPPAAPDGRRAPVVAVVSGRGGVGKTVLACSLAATAARFGLRAALVDLDLMCGDAWQLLGIDELVDFSQVRSAADTDFEQALEQSAMRVAPGLTLWGPIARPEQAELMGASAERVCQSLRAVADVVFVDTSTSWNDSVAAALGLCDRCLVVGGPGSSMPRSSVRACDLAARLGVPRTKMTSVFCGASPAEEDSAMRFEMALSLHSRLRIADGGHEVAAIESYAHLREVLEGGGPFARDIAVATKTILSELGCAFDAPEEDEPSATAEHGHLVLPWKKTRGGTR